MTARKALRGGDDGVLLDLDVSPGASDARFPSGFNPWRERVEARVRSPPQDGAANRELTELVAGFFDLDPRAVAIVHGAAGRRKTVLLRGSSLETVGDRLDDAL